MGYIMDALAAEKEKLDQISIILKNGKQITFEIEDDEVVVFGSDYLTIGEEVAEDEEDYEPRVKLKTKDIAGYGKNLTGV